MTAAAPILRDLLLALHRNRPPAPILRWFLDGIELAATPPPYRWSWKLTRGRHTLLATTPDLTGSSAVRLHVE